MWRIVEEEKPQFAIVDLLYDYDERCSSSYEVEEKENSYESVHRPFYQDLFSRKKKGKTLRRY